ncbi:TetR family transcriptional regulator [Streptomyces caniscabiei]|uniref:TetR/AcrR family transcriptional regulator n=1 Tax=Streptomyces caniscabiei TaxID=2746961 RepID=UPI0029B8875F|nr:TetR family transcriptional regulator [Streptomyces caniscabiei]MDX2604271.1 TetR family transcriptional regulator [Streptomyces caniscabiei]MDX2735613.1 TetR family transcriptional regulator [Streptomyces caniscabiei]MDX2781913.1 TetR family transcriptional regulator [Streptomyces caniscabiei]
MPRDAAATRRNILDAAVEEFSTRGFAGARVERISEVAEANKRMIYVYFGNKEGLFSAVLDQVIGTLIAEVPVTEDDLPGYAGRMFDHLLAHPEALRLSLWRQLERPAIGPDAAGVYTSKVKAMTGQHGSVHPSGLPATDLLVLVQGMAASWLISPADLLAADGTDPSSADRLAAHRAALVEAVRRISTPGPHLSV